MPIQSVILLEKAYGPNKDAAIKAFKHIISRLLKDLNVKIVKLERAEKNWIKVILNGEDAEAAKNYLAKEFYTTTLINQLKKGDIIKGKLVDVEEYGYGVYVDIGILDPRPKDALIPLYVLRKQLAKGYIVSTRQIVKKYAFMNNLPMEVKIRDVDERFETIEAELSKNQVKKYEEWIKHGLDRIFVCGATRQMIRKAIIRSGHLRDILSIERLGLLEHAIVCKPSTTAQGLIAEIGKYLPKIPMKAFKAKEIKKWLKELDMLKGPTVKVR